MAHHRPDLGEVLVLGKQCIWHKLMYVMKILIVRKSAGLSKLALSQQYRSAWLYDQHHSPS